MISRSNSRHLVRVVSLTALIGLCAGLLACGKSGPVGTFARVCEATTDDGQKLTELSALRFRKDGKLCRLAVGVDRHANIDLLTIVDLREFSEACDQSAEFNPKYDVIQYARKRGNVTFTIGQSDYSGRLQGEKLVLASLHRSTQTREPEEEEFVRYYLDGEAPAGANGEATLVPGIWHGQGDGFAITFTVALGGNQISGGQATVRAAGGQVSVQMLNEPIRIESRRFRFSRTGSAMFGPPSFSMEGVFESRDSVSGLANGSIRWTGRPGPAR